MVTEANFDFVEEPVPALEDGEVLVRNLYMSFDPAMRGWMEDRPSYLPPVQIGEVMRAGGAGRVVESRNPSLPEGALVQGLFGWQEYAVAGPGLNQASPVPEGATLPQTLGVLGTTGLTAYFGLLDLGEPKQGGTVLVSGAAGATGSVAGQIAKLKGCRVVGIAGGAEKCGWLTSELGFDAAIDYKSENLGQRIAALCPDGLDVFFDNVGGATLEAALANLALRARVVLCGGISGYNEDEPPPGPRNLMNLILRRARMEGFIVIDYAPRFREAVKELMGWVAAGQIRHQEDIQEGIENAPRTFQRLFLGENRGKQLLKLADPE
jgi:NADPH-dependent curcumin reductase CurA